MPVMNDNAKRAQAVIEALGENQRKGIFPTPAGTFELRYREGKKQRSKTFAGLDGDSGLLAFRDRLSRRKVEGKPTVRRGDVPLLEDFGNECLALWDHLEESTLAGYAQVAEVHIYPLLGHLRVHGTDLRPGVLADWQEQRLKEGAGPAQLEKAQGLLKRFLDRAVLKEYFEVNPVLALPKPEWDPEGHRWLTVAEVEAIRNWYLDRGDHMSATLISCFAYIGPRPQMFLALEWTGLLPNPPRWAKAEPGACGMLLTQRNSQGKIKSGSKTSKGQKSTIYVPGPVAEDLEKWHSASRAFGGLVFADEKGNPWSKTKFGNWRSRQRTPREKDRQNQRNDQRSFKLATTELGLTGVTPYSLRHTAATLLAASGWNHVQIGWQLQHGPETSLRVYQHLLDQAPPENNPHTIDGLIREARGEVTPTYESRTLVAN